MQTSQPLLTWFHPLEIKNVREVRSFHGLVSFNRHFILNFSTIIYPITDYMKFENFEWTNLVTRTCHQIKQKLTVTRILVLPDFAQPFELHCDTFMVGIGVVLSQNGRPMAYFSKKLSMSRLNYSKYTFGVLCIGPSPSPLEFVFGL